MRVVGNHTSYFFDDGSIIRALRSLRQLPAADLAPHLDRLASLLDDEEWGVRYVSLNSDHFHASEDYNEEEEIDMSVRLLALEVFGSAGEHVQGRHLTLLISHLDFLWWNCSGMVLGQLGEFAAPAVPKILELFDRNPTLALAVVEELGIVAAECAPRVAVFLASPCASLVCRATRVLGHLGPAATPHVPDLVRLLSGSDHLVSGAVEALGRIAVHSRAVVASPAVVSRVHALVSQPSCFGVRRRAALIALAAFGSRAIAHCSEVAKPDPSVCGGQEHCEVLETFARTLCEEQRDGCLACSRTDAANALIRCLEAVGELSSARMANALPLGLKFVNGVITLGATSGGLALVRAADAICDAHRELALTCPVKLMLGVIETTAQSDSLVPARTAAVEALAKLAPLSWPALASATEDTESVVRLSALRALRRTLLSLGCDSASTAVLANMRDLPMRVAPRLADGLAAVRAAAAELIGELDGLGALPESELAPLAEALAACVGDVERDVRLAALEALGLLGARGWLDAASPAVRARVRAAAAGRDGPTGRGGDDAHARMLALHALACQRPAPSAECVAVLCAVAADDRDVDLRRAAGRGLGAVLEGLGRDSAGEGESARRRLMCASALGGLGAMTRDADSEIRETAAAALRAAAISARTALPGSEATIVAVVSSCASDAAVWFGADVVCAAAVWFGEACDFTELAGSPRARRAKVAPYLSSIAPRIVDGDARVFAVVVWALGRAGKAAAPYAASIAARLDDDDPDVRSAAASCLAALTLHVADETTAGSLAEQLMRAFEAAAPDAASADAKMRERALFACAPLLSRHRAVVEPHVRHVASRVLDEDGGAGLTAAALACVGRMADAAIVQQIVARLTHAAPEVRAAAMRALGHAAAVAPYFECMLRALRNSERASPPVATQGPTSAASDSDEDEDESSEDDDSDDDDDGNDDDDDSREEVRRAAHDAFTMLAQSAAPAERAAAMDAATVLCDVAYSADQRDAAASVLRALSNGGGAAATTPAVAATSADGANASAPGTGQSGDTPNAAMRHESGGILAPPAPSAARQASEDDAPPDTGATPARKKLKAHH